MNRIKIPISYKLVIPIGLIASLLLFQFMRSVIYDNQNYFFAVIISFLCLYFFFLLPLMVIMLGILPMQKFASKSEINLDAYQKSMNTQDRKESYAIKISQILSYPPAAIISLFIWHWYGNFQWTLFVFVLITMAILTLFLNLFEIPVKSNFRRKK